MEVRIWFASLCCTPKTKIHPTKVQPQNAADLRCIVDSNTALVLEKVRACLVSQ